MFKLSRRESQGRENSVQGSCKSIMIKEPQILLVLVDGINRIKDSGLTELGEVSVIQMIKGFMPYLRVAFLSHR